MIRPSALRSLFRCLALVVLLGQMVVPAHAEAPIVGVAGRVMHIVTQEPIAGAAVSVDDTYVLTDDQGWYTLDLPAGRYTVEARANGFIGMSQTLVSVSENLTPVDFAMIPSEADADMQAQVQSQLDLYEQTIPVEIEEAVASGEVVSSGVTAVPATIRLLVREDPAVIDSPAVEVVTLDFEEYLKGVVPNEMSPAWPQEALRAQAVAARSYAAANLGKHASEGADVCSSVHCQVWRPTHYATSDAAVEATRGVAATYAGNIIYAFFHGHCDGHTRNSEDVWSAALPYCRAVACTCGYTSLYGHGVGMCQYGARAMANAGSTYDEIIKHYYTGVSLLAGPSGSLTAAAATPTSGSETTSYTFSVLYTSTAATPPPIANAIIDGYSHAMTLVGGSAGSGWGYSYTTYLAAGSHSYRFEFDDGYGRLAKAPSSGTLAGPVVSDSASPPADDARRGNLSASTALDWSGGQMDGVQLTTSDKDTLTVASGHTSGTYTSPVLIAASQFVAYGLSWYTDSTDTSLTTMETRSSLDGTSWGDWHTEIGESYVSSNPRLQSAELVFGEAEYVQYRVTLTANSSGSAPALRNVRISFTDTRSGPSAIDLAQSTSSTPTVISRASWGADESWMTWSPDYRTIRAIIMHHTVTDEGGVDPAAIVRAIYWYHAIERGWGDIGYNYLVDHYGNVYQGRYGGVGVVGHHAGDPYNYGSVGISLIGNFEDNPVPTAMYNGLIEFLAYQCTLHSLDPVGDAYLIDRTVPTILGHRDVSATACPGVNFYTLLPTVRTDTLAMMAPDAPTITMSAPIAGQLVRSVVTPAYSTTGVITHMSYYVDDVLQAEDSEEFTWKWNTTHWADGAHTLRVVVQNGGGSASASAAVTVDNTAPSSTVSATTWIASGDFALTVTGGDATWVSFSPGWTWEGEDLFHQIGVYATDSDASQGAAWQGRGGVDSGGAWYGPYSCDLAVGDYQVLYRLRTDDISTSTGLATLDIADEGHTTYALQPVAADDFASTGYQEFVLPLAYGSTAQSCLLSTGGLEFRTWYSGLGNLWLDRVRVFTAPVVSAGTHTWPAPASEGRFSLTVRLLDDAGNATERALSLGVDRSAPHWSDSYGSGFWARDELSGLEPAGAAYRVSGDGGTGWGEWQPLSISASSGATGYVLFDAGLPAGSWVQYKAVDRVGNESTSQVVETGLEHPALNERVYLPFISP